MNDTSPTGKLKFIETFSRSVYPWGSSYRYKSSFANNKLTLKLDEEFLRALLRLLTSLNLHCKEYEPISKEDFFSMADFSENNNVEFDSPLYIEAIKITTKGD